MRKSIVEIDRKDIRYKQRTRVARLRQSKLFEFDVPCTRNPLGRRYTEPKIIIIDDEDNNIDKIKNDEEVYKVHKSISNSEDFSEDVECAGGMITCPMCSTDISYLPLYAREAHCDKCTDGKLRIVLARSRTIPLPEVKVVRFPVHTVAVDAFMYMDHTDVQDYFLSHFHADHYQGLCKSWSQGQLYCLQITAALVMYKFKLERERITILDIGKKYYLKSNFRCTALDANHCPGAAIFLFEQLNDTHDVIRSVLHTGDFRASEEMENQIREITNNRALDCVYLDTTYLNPYYNFPLQESVLKTTADFVSSINENGLKSHFGDSQKSILAFTKTHSDHSYKYRYLYLIGRYNVGKERLALAIANRLGTKIFISKDNGRYKILNQYLEWFPDEIITCNPEESSVHLVSFDILSSEQRIETYKNMFPQLYSDVIGFLPTGWSYSNSSRYISSKIIMDRFKESNKRYNYVKSILENGEVDQLKLESFNAKYKPNKRYQVFKIPYSEHSSFKDLCRFGINLEILTIKSTVNIKDAAMHSIWYNTWATIR